MHKGKNSPAIMNLLLNIKINLNLTVGCSLVEVFFEFLNVLA